MPRNPSRKNWTGCRRKTLSAAVLAALLAAPLAQAQQATQHFDVSSQPLSRALLEFGQQAKISIAAPQTLVSGKTSAAVSGDMTARDALARLLAGSGLEFQFVNDTAVRVIGPGGNPSIDPNARQAPAASPPAKEGAVAISEIIVTARRVEENLQRVPTTVTAFTDTDIQSKRIETAQDLQQFVPSMAVYSFSGIREGTQYALRGQSTTTGATAGVVVYLNEVPMAPDLASSSSGGGPGLYLDLENLLVLNGPQGTLFGRNTTGGAVLLTSKQPTNKLEGYVQAGFGNYNNREYEGVLNVPLIDEKLLLRVAARQQTRDGFTRNIVNGDDLDNRDNWAMRATLSFQPSDALQNDFIYYATGSRSDGTGRLITQLNPSAPVYPVLAQALADQQARSIRDVANDAATKESARYWSATDTATWSITDDLVLKNIAAYQSIQSTNNGDEDGTAMPILSNFLHSHTASKSEELQLQGESLSGNLSWTVGGFYDSSKPEGPQNLNVNIFGGAIVSNLTTGTNRHSRALYTQETYNLGDLAAALDGLNLTGGYRYTWDYRSDFQTSIAGSVEAVEKSAAGTWTLGLDYPIDPDTFVYLKGSQGYKAGGFNPSSLDPNAVTFKPEYVRDIEFGLKRNWNFDTVQLRTNIDAFHTDYTDIQKPILQIVNQTPTTITQNVAEATIDGIELAVTFVPHPTVEFAGSYSYLDAKYTKGDLGFDTHLPFYYTPKNKYSLTGTLHVPIARDWGKLNLSASYAYTGALFTAHKIETGDTLPGYGLLNFRADWLGIADAPIDLSLFVTNATDKEYQISSIPLYTDFGFNVGTFGEPRMYGMQLRYHW